jgi:hypothetical protein
MSIEISARNATRPAFRPGDPWLDNHGVPINAHGAGFLWHEGTCYWYGEHKVAGEAGNRAQVGVHVYTSRDLYHWTDAGIALPVSSDPASDLARGCILERPKVLFNRSTRQFVMWFHLEPVGRLYTAARCGVAVADHPAGPFRYLESFCPNAGVWPTNVDDADRHPLTADEAKLIEGLELGGAPRPYFPKNLLYRRDFAEGQMSRDLTLWQEDDGTAFHLYASEDNGTLHISQLSEDYLRPVGRYIRIFAGRFHEAPALMKHGGRYFLFTSDCTGWAPNTTRLSWAPSIWGPWEELATPCIGTGRQIVTSFESQPTAILSVPDRPGAFIYVADRWCPKNAIDGRYVWLPIEFMHGVPTVQWRDTWDLSIFA